MKGLGKTIVGALIAFNVATAANMVLTEYGGGYPRDGRQAGVLAVSFAEAAGRSVHHITGPGAAGDITAGMVEIVVGTPAFVLSAPGVLVGGVVTKAARAGRSL
jgi:hypothetical protein